MADVLLGKDTETGEPVYLTAEGRQLSTYIIGTIGSGKSTLLEQIAIQDMQNGDGLCFLDPHDESAERILEHVPSDRKDDVIVWDPGDRRRPFGLNPFFCDDEDEIDRKAQDFIEALGSLKEFSEIFESAPQMIPTLQNTALAFILNQGMTLAEAPKFLEKESYRKKFYPSIPQEYEQVTEFWKSIDKKLDREQERRISSSLNKVQRFQSDRIMKTIFGQKKTSINFRKAMDSGKIILVKLNSQSVGANNAAFIGAFIVYEIYRAARSRSDTPEHKRRQFHLIADEFQTYMTTVFPTLIEEVRKYNVDVTIAHQRRDQLPRNGRNAPLVAGNKVVFTISGHDAEELVKEFNTAAPEQATVGQKEKYTFVSQPLKHLATRGHENREVLDAYQDYKDALDRFTRFAHDVSDGIPSYLLDMGLSDGERNRYFLQATERLRDSFEQSMFRTMTASSEKDCERYFSWTDDASYILGDSIASGVVGMAGRTNLWEHPTLSGYFSSFLFEYGYAYIMRIDAWNDMWINYLAELERIVNSEEMADEVHAIMNLKALGFETFKRVTGDVPYVENDGTPELARQELANRILFEQRSRDPFIKTNRKKEERLEPISDTLKEYPTIDIDISPYEMHRAYSDEIDEYLDSNKTIDPRRPRRSIKPPSIDEKRHWEVAEFIYINESWLLKFAARLGRLLHRYPCYAHTGQLEPVLEPRRQLHDVEAEIANTLASLPRFTARCKLIQRSRSQEFTIETYDRPSPEPYAQTQADQIKSDSRHFYGKKRSKVEKKIARRLRDGPQQPAPDRAEPGKAKQPTDFWESE